MKRNEFIQLKGLDIKELKAKVKATRKELDNLVLDKNMKKIKDLKIVSKKKKELAQMLTLIKQKELLVKLESEVKDSKVNSTSSSLRGRLGDRGNLQRTGKIASSPASPDPRNDSKRKGKKS